MKAIYRIPILGTALLAAYEIYAVLSAKPRPLSISQIMWLALGVVRQCPYCLLYSKKSIVGGVALAFAFGFLMGHFFA